MYFQYKGGRDHDIERGRILKKKNSQDMIRVFQRNKKDITIHLQGKK